MQFKYSVQDQNLVDFPDDPFYVTVKIVLKNSHTMRISRQSLILRCAAKNLELKMATLSDLRFFYQGQRIHSRDTPESLGMIDGDDIEVLKELSGGGRRNKKDISNDADKILEILDMSSTKEENIRKITRKNTFKEK